MVREDLLRYYLFRDLNGKEKICEALVGVLPCRGVAAIKARKLHEEPQTKLDSRERNSEQGEGW